MIYNRIDLSSVSLTVVVFMRIWNIEALAHLILYRNANNLYECKKLDLEYLAVYFLDGNTTIVVIFRMHLMGKKMLCHC